MERLKNPKSVDPATERSSVVLFEPNAPMRNKLANFYKSHGLIVYVANHLAQLQDSMAPGTAPSMVVVKFDQNRDILEQNLQRLQAKFKTRIPVVILANHIGSNDLLGLVQMGVRSVLLKLEDEENWQSKVAGTLEFARPKYL